MALHQVNNLLVHSRWCTLAGALSLVHSLSSVPSRWCPLATALSLVGALSLLHSRWCPLATAAIDALMCCYGLTQPLLQDMTMTPGELQGGPNVCEDLERRGSREAEATMMIRFCCYTSTCRRAAAVAKLLRPTYRLTD